MGFSGRFKNPGGLEVLYVLGGDQDQPAADFLDQVHKGTFVVAQACYASPLTERANVVLPSSLWREQAGTVTNTDGLVQDLFKAVEPAGEAKADWEILTLLEEKIGQKPALSLEKPAGNAHRHIQ